MQSYKRIIRLRILIDIIPFNNLTLGFATTYNRIARVIDYLIVIA